LFSFFNGGSKTSISINELEARMDFSYAIQEFTLAHCELIAFSVSLKVQEFSQMAADLAAATQQISATAEETSATVEEISASMQFLKSKEMDNFNRVAELNEMSKEVVVMLDGMVSNATELLLQIKDVDNISQNVSEIADQTNLLSLNAAIEAARAGEHGRGFSVVAEEVRKLSDQTKTAVKEVKTISNQMNNKAQHTDENVSGVKSAFDKYISETEIVSEMMRSNVRKVEETAEASENIAQAAQQQAVAMETQARITNNLAQATDFGEMLKRDTDNLIEVIKPYVRGTEKEHNLSVLGARLKEHAAFLRETMEVAGKGAVLASHQECTFGKWYKKEFDKYNNIVEYVAIDEPHRRFHEAANALALDGSLSNVNKVIDASIDILRGFLKLSEVMR
jgi:methyl-accepting chemotaxis protein